MNASRFSVQDKSILITGATGSLGSAATRALAEAGARLTLTGGNTERLAELAAETGRHDLAVVVRRPDTRPTPRPWSMPRWPSTAGSTASWLPRA